MRVIAKRALREFWEEHPEVQGRLEAWYHTVREASWEKPLDVREQYPTGSAIEDSRFVFRIGNDYRLVAHVAYDYYTVYIKWLGTHDEYDDIDPTEVDDY